MAFDAKPSTWLGAGYSVASNAINLTTNDSAGTKCLTELTDTEAHATTGDIRKVIFAIVEKLYAAWNAIATADRPTKMSVAKSSSVNSSTGVVTNQYTFTIYTTIASQEVQAES